MFPSLKSWIKAGLLFASTYGVMGLINIHLWPLIILCFVDPVFLYPAGTFLALSLVAFIILRGLYALFLRIFWSNPPKWIRAAPLRKTLIHWTVCLIAALPVSILMVHHIVVLGLALTDERLFLALRTDAYKEIFARDMMRSSWAWIISSAYLYNILPFLD